MQTAKMRSGSRTSDSEGPVNVVKINKRIAMCEREIKGCEKTVAKYLKAIEEVSKVSLNNHESSWMITSEEDRAIYVKTYTNSVKKYTKHKADYEQEIIKLRSSLINYDDGTWE